MSRRVIAVIGGQRATARQKKQAREVGRRIAEAGCVLVTGGLGGVMESASRGAREAAGLVIGIVPGDDANPHVDVAIRTRMGDARNAILVNTADAFVAIGGAHGTLSEIAYARKRRKRVAGLGTWKIPGVLRVRTPAEAVRAVLR